MNWKDQDFVGEKEFLRLDYKLPISYSNMVFESLEQAMIAMMTDDQVIWQIICSSEGLDVAYDLLPEIQRKKVSEYDYNERLMNLVLAKYSIDDMWDRLYYNTSEDDTFEYRQDYRHKVGLITAYIRKHGLDDLMGLANYIQGEC